MAYVVVMGGLVLSVSFTLGWLLWRIGRWALTLVRGAPGRVRGKSGARKAPPSRRTAKPRREAAPEPWEVTRWLARRRSVLPLSSLALLLYGLTRLVEFGMTQRPLSPPTGYHGLVAVLGWSAALLLVLLLLHLLASWRCRER